jgi:threonine aldolase
MIDLRSDTVSLPTPEMRAAIAGAQMGDDCFGNDRTTRELEAYCADYFGKEAALFTTGGTQSNQIAMKALTNPGDEIIINAAYHINFFEAAATSTFSGVNFNLLHSEDGSMTREAVEDIFATKARWNNNYAMPRVIVLENTVGSKGGTVLDLTEMQSIHAYAHDRGATLYLDGARILHAVAATGISARHYASACDCLSMCFSKSLGAPVGSIMVGTRDFIARARRYRKWFGGDMHQSGIVAAAATYAIRHNTDRLHLDHENAEVIYMGTKDLPGINATWRGTNMVYVDVAGLGTTADIAAQTLRANGVDCLAWDDSSVRFVTHLDIDRNMATRAAGIIRQTLSYLPPAPVALLSKSSKEIAYVSHV